MLRREMYPLLLATVIAAGCSEVKKSDEGGASGTSAAASGSGGTGGNAGSGGSGMAGDGSSGGDTGSAGDGSGGTDAAGSGGGMDAAGSGGGSGGSGSGGTDAAGSGTPVDGIPCGREVCTTDMCCADPFAGVCGAPLPTNDRACLPPPPEDAMAVEGCPSLNIMNIFSIPSCCVDGQCGVDGSSFGFPGCTELSEAQANADAMGYGAFITFPAPQPCP